MPTKFVLDVTKVENRHAFCILVCVPDMYPMSSYKNLALTHPGQ